MKEYIKRFYSGLPEAFYDGLAYIIPASHLAVGIELLYRPFSIWVAIYLKKNQPWVVDLFLAFIVLGGLYIVGQVLTTCSFYILHVPRKWITQEKTETWYNNYRRIEIELPKVSLLVTKRYARWMSSRNIVLSSILLTILSAIAKKYLYMTIFGISSLFLLIDLVVRYRWLKEYIKIVIAEADKINANNRTES